MYRFPKKNTIDLKEGNYQLKLFEGTPRMKNIQIRYVEDLVSIPQNSMTAFSIPISTTDFDNIYCEHTYVYNQLVSIPNNDISTVKNGITIKDNRDGTYTLNGTATANTYFSPMAYIPIIGHKYFMKGCPKGGSSETYQVTDSLKVLGSDTGEGVIITQTTATTSNVAIRIAKGYTCNNLVFIPQLIDLTLMFGNNDWIDTSFLKSSYFNKPYMPYNKGLIVPCNFNSILITGQNIYKPSSTIINATLTGDIGKDPSFETTSDYAQSSIMNPLHYTRVQGGAPYYISYFLKGGNTDYEKYGHAQYKIYELDSNKKTINIQTIDSVDLAADNYFTTSEYTWYVYISLNVDFYYDDLKNGYFFIAYDDLYGGETEYKEKLITLPSPISLYASNGVGSDTIASYSAISRDFIKIDLGDLNWTKHPSNNRWQANITKAYVNNGYGSLQGMICSGYSQITPLSMEGGSPQDKSIAMGGNLNIMSVYDSALVDKEPSEVKETLKGIEVVYQVENYTEDYDFPEIVFQNDSAVNVTFVSGDKYQDLPFRIDYGVLFGLNEFEKGKLYYCKNSNFDRLSFMNTKGIIK